VTRMIGLTSFCFIVASLSLAGSGGGSTTYAMPQRAEIRWLGRPPTGGPLNADNWQAATWRLAGRDSTEMPQFCCALDIAADNDRLVTFRQGAKIAIEIGRRRLETVAILVPAGFFQEEMRIRDVAAESFALSRRSTALWDDKWMRIYLWFSIPELEEKAATRLFSRVDWVWFDGIIVSDN
jgi:hypothetical protein